MKDKITKLIDVKSIMTLALVGAFFYGFVTKMITPSQFFNIFTVIVSFYFGTQYQKNAETQATDTNITSKAKGITE